VGFILTLVWPRSAFFFFLCLVPRRFGIVVEERGSFLPENAGRSRGIDYHWQQGVASQGFDEALKEGPVDAATNAVQDRPVGHSGRPSGGAREAAVRARRGPALGHTQPRDADEHAHDAVGRRAGLRPTHHEPDGAAHVPQGTTKMMSLIICMVSFMPNSMV
jgi:hypothetical protein